MIGNIQLLRALAAYAVVVCHTAAGLATCCDVRTNAAWTCAGVDVFFVISGFIMIYATRSSWRTPTAYLRDRLIRIAPTYWVGTMGMVALLWLGFHPAGLRRLDVGDVLASMLFWPNVRADGQFEPVLSPGWTLNYEMFFYLLFALTLGFRSHLKSLAVLSTIFVGLSVIGWSFSSNDIYFVHFTNSIMLEFVAGMGLGLLYLKGELSPLWRSLPLGIVLVVAGTAAIPLAAYLGFDSDSELGRPTRCFAFGVPALAIVAGALILDRARVRANAAWMQRQGAASYAVYVFHMFVVQPALKLTLRFNPIPGVLGTIIDILFVVVCAGAVGTAVHVWLELPTTQWLKQLGRTPRGALGAPLAEK
jgi:peptidoglycan/LPS O-acetylase OafA/YrhL